MTVRVLVADDHPLFRYGVRFVIDADPTLDLVGEALNGETAVSLAQEIVPDVILMDINMPEVNGIEATRRIVASHPEIAVLIVTMFEDDDSVVAAMRAGARGYLLKGADAGEIARAIHAVADGQAIFGPKVADRLARHFAQPSTGEVKAFPGLTERERAILELVARGYTNTEVADRLYLSPKTVRNYVSTILQKMDVSTRGEAIARARDAGLGEAPPG